MLFGRGNWAVFGVKQGSEAAFQAALDDEGKLADFTQTAAIALTKSKGLPTFGINPFGSPRDDERGMEVKDGQQFSLGKGVFGLWFCQNEYEDVTDPASKKEALAYANLGKPFKFCNKDEKKLIEENVKASA